MIKIISHFHKASDIAVQGVVNRCHTDLLAMSSQALKTQFSDTHKIVFIVNTQNNKTKGVVLLHLVDQHSANILFFGHKGFVTKSLIKKVYQTAFDDFDLCRVTAKIYTDNVTSLSIAKRLGFVFEGTLRQVKPGCDLHMLSMLPGECPFVGGVQ